LVVDVPDHARDFLQDAWYDRNDMYSSQLLKKRFCESYEKNVRTGHEFERWLEVVKKKRAAAAS
jgi:hypothetical protein